MPLLESNLDIDRCPHCSVAKPNLKTVYTMDTDNYSATNQRCWYVYVCSKCGGVVIAYGRKSGGQITEIYPHATEVDNTIPVPAHSYLQQALDSIHAPAGAVMLAASSVDAMLKKSGYTEGSLYSRIDKAATDNIITSSMAKWAHEIRLEANGQRHADMDEQLPDEKDAKRVIDFALALGQFLFVLPAKVKQGIEGI